MSAVVFKKPSSLPKADPFAYRLPKHKEKNELNSAITEIFDSKIADISIQIAALKTLLSHSQPRELIELAVEKIVSRACVNKNSLSDFFQDAELPHLLFQVAKEKLNSLSDNLYDGSKSEAASKALSEYKSKRATSSNLLKLRTFEANIEQNQSIKEIFQYKTTTQTGQVKALKTLLSYPTPRNLLELAVEKIVKRACKNNHSLKPLFEDKQLPPALIAIALKKLISFKEDCSIADPKRKAALDALKAFRGLNKPSDKEYYSNLLKEFSSEEMPDGDSIGTAIGVWLDIYWEKLGEEKGRPLTEEEKTQNIPDKVSPNLATANQDKF